MNSREEVERLQREIEQREERLRQIQSECAHQWELAGQDSVDLVESLLPGVYVGATSGPVGEGLRQPKLGFHIWCRGCLRITIAHQGNTCPKCFSTLEDGMMHFREEVFGYRYLYYGARVKHCPKLHYSVACDEWNQ